MANYLFRTGDSTAGVKKAQYSNCDAVPSKIAVDNNVPKIDLNSVMVNEGGSVEIDGNGVLMACKSSILNNNRNPGMTQQQAEDIFTKNLGVTKFIWLEGKAGLDITDMHIDGFARFANSSTIITMNSNDLAYWQVPDNDINNLYNATGKNGAAYQFVKVPLTKHEVTTTYGKKVGRASYINYYIANNRVLVPNYNDPNDAVANNIIQQLYPDKKGCWNRLPKSVCQWWHGTLCYTAATPIRLFYKNKNYLLR